MIINKGFCDAAKAFVCIWLIINKYGETAFVFGIIHVLSEHLRYKADGDIRSVVYREGGTSSSFFSPFI